MKTRKKGSLAARSALFATTLFCLSIAGISQTWSTALNAFPVGQSGNFGTIGDNSILFKTNSTTRLTMAKDGKITIPDLAGDGDRLLMVDAAGMLKFIPNPNSASCGGTMPWVQGGNMIVNPIGIPNEIGTCDNFAFVLKANNVKSIYMQPSGKIGIGAGNNNSNQVPLVDFLDPANSNTNHLKIYANATGAIESSADMGLYNNGNFGIYQGSPGNSTARLSIDANGYTKILNNMDIGNLNNNNARLGVEALNSDGVLVYADNGSTALHIANGAGASRFKVWVNPGGNDDTKAHLAAATQIGFIQTVGMADNTVRLNVDASGGVSNGVKVTTNNSLSKTFYGEFNGVQTFIVTGEGKTQIGPPVAGITPSAYWLTVNGKVGAREVMVTLTSPWPDYVFEKNYKLGSLEDLEQYIKKNKHLPNVPSAEAIKNEAFGLNLGEMQGRQMEKIEELYLHLISLNAEKKELKKQMEDLKVLVLEQQRKQEDLQKELMKLQEAR